VEVNTETGVIRVIRAVVAGDAGQVVSHDGLACQLEGGVLQAISWTLKERVRFGPQRIESVDWETYPILTFPEAPPVEAILINRPGEPYLGSGEGSQGPGGAALANAVAHACGTRLREIPFTPERVRAMLAAAKREK
jgi:nicotinate dehydrogenase subunit B